MRINLKVFRIKQHMTQKEISARLGYSRATYAAIENGVRNGRYYFWADLQAAFDVTDAEMWELMKNE